MAKSFSAAGLPAFLAAALLGARFAEVPIKVPDRPVRWWPAWTDAITWRAGLLEGGTSAVYFGTNAFLATQLHAVGHPGLVGLPRCAEHCAAGRLVHRRLRRSARRRPHYLLAVGAACAVAGLAGIVFAPGPLAIVGSAVVGISSAVVFIVALALPAARWPQ